MRELKLKAVAHANFRYSEEKNFNEYIKGNGASLSKGEGILFVSKSNDQLVFVEPANEFSWQNKHGKSFEVRVIASQRFRIRGGKWNPAMLSRYAEEAGIKIAGIKKFEWYFKEYLDCLKDAA